METESKQPLLQAKPQQTWCYDPGDRRRKHRWGKDEAGFLDSPSGPVGKCHRSINHEIATKLLREGVVYHAPGTDMPEHVYAVYRGVIYEAAPTQPGVSFHGYPWRGNQGRPALPPRILRQLEQCAEAEGYGGAFKTWLKQYS
jgi:hypothetical protein